MHWQAGGVGDKPGAGAALLGPGAAGKHTSPGTGQLGVRALSPGDCGNRSVQGGLAAEASELAAPFA